MFIIKEFLSSVYVHMSATSLYQHNIITSRETAKIALYQSGLFVKAEKERFFSSLTRAYELKPNPLRVYKISLSNLS